MCEPIALDDYRAQITARKTREALTSQLPSERFNAWTSSRKRTPCLHDEIYVLASKRKHTIFAFSSTGAPMVVADGGTVWTLQPHEYRHD